jgi:hypothetical protein
MSYWLNKKLHQVLAYLAVLISPRLVSITLLAPSTVTSDD